MSTSTESCYTKLGGIAAVLALVLGFLAWRCPYLPPAPVSVTPESTPEDPRLRPGDAPAGSSGETKSTNPEPQDSPIKPPPREGSTEPVLPLKPAPAPEVPTEFTLSDGEQKVLLSGRASVGIQFNQLGEERFLTLRINSDGAPQVHAILGAAARYSFRVGEAEYQVSLLSADHGEKTASLSIDRTN